MASKLLHLVALSSLAILACSFGATPVNALSIDNSPKFARHFSHHQVIAKKRADTRRCKPRPSSSASPVKTPAATSTSKAAAAPSAPPNPPANPPPPPAPAPAPAPPPSNAGNGKVGIAWALGDDPALRNFKTGKVSSVYTWSPWKPAGTSAGFDFVPMLWGPKQLADFKRLVTPGYASTVLGFNEPDHDGQANLDPGYAAQLWRDNIQPLKGQGYRLISPAVTSAPSGKTWMRNFFNACSGCTFDGLALHWYGTDAQQFIAYLTDFHNTFGMNIWVTEFACQNFAGGAQCSRDQVFSFMNTVTNFMDNTPWVSKYFAFGVMHDMVGVNPANQLMAGNGQPTDLGWDYLT